jgi:hypothetical protein
MLINTIPLLEAKDSSEIKNIVTTADRLFPYAHSAAGVDSADAVTKEALRCRTNLRPSIPSPISNVPEGGVIFSDGMEADALASGAGMTVAVGLAVRAKRLMV